jgi:hypothetical protein
MRRHEGMIDLSRWSDELCRRARLRFDRAKKLAPDTIRTWNHEMYLLGVIGEAIYAVTTGQKMKPHDPDRVGDDGWDFKARGRFIDVKARPGHRDLLWPDSDALKADWYIVVSVQKNTYVGEVVGGATKDMLKVAPPAPASIAVHQPARFIEAGELLPLPDWMFICHNPR